MIPETSRGLVALQLCWESHFGAAVETDMPNNVKARTTAQIHTEPVDTPKPTNRHCTALQRDEILLHQPEHRHKLRQPGKRHRELTQPHPQGQTPQPRTMTLKTLKIFFSFLFFSYTSHCLFPQHISTFRLAFSSAVEFSFLLKKIILRLFLLKYIAYSPTCFHYHISFFAMLWSFPC